MSLMILHATGMTESEACLKESIYYLEHGNVSARGLYTEKQSSIIFSEKNREKQ